MQRVEFAMPYYAAGRLTCDGRSVGGGRRYTRANSPFTIQLDSGGHNTLVTHLY